MIKFCSLWLVIMGGYVGAIIYPFIELTHYIRLYVEKYGLAQFLLMSWQQEVIIIWTGFGLSVILVGILTKVALTRLLEVRE